MEKLEKPTVKDLKIKENRIGKGSFSKVYKYKTENGEFAAIKIFTTEISDDKIKNLARRILAIRHENVAAFCGYSLDPPAVSFEYCEVQIEGKKINTVRKLIAILVKQKKFNFLERLSYCYQAIEGLTYLHKNGIIHQDVKPSNMLVSGPPHAIVVKLCDYGEMSSFKDTCATSTRIKDGYVGLTLTYMAPEICRNEVTKPTIETDAFALGISAFEIFSGLENAWQKNLSAVKDSLILNALEHGHLPKTTCLDEMYEQQNGQFIKEMLKILWTERNLEKVNIFNRLLNCPHIFLCFINFVNKKNRIL